MLSPEMVARQMYGAYCRFVSSVEDPAVWDDLLMSASHGCLSSGWVLNHWRLEAEALIRMIQSNE